MAASESFQFGPFILDPAEHLLLRDAQAVPLTPKAFDLLTLLVTHAGRLLTKEELLEQLWRDVSVEESNLTYHVFAVRKALGETEQERYVETVPRRGYRFVAPVAVVPRSVPTPDAAPATPVVRRPHMAIWLITAAAVGLAVWFARTPSRPTDVRAGAAVRFQIPVPEGMAGEAQFSLSPDGAHLVFPAAGADGVVHLWRRDLGSLQIEPIPGTDLPAGGVPPMFWSADGRSLAFDTGGMLKRVPLAGGPTQDICSLPNAGVGGTWNTRGVILVGNSVGPILRCQSSGGAARPVTNSTSAQQDVVDLFPSFLPDGRHFLFLRVCRSRPDLTGVFVGDIEAAPANQRTDRLLATGFGVTYVPDGIHAGSGWVLFVRDQQIFAQRFDERRQALDGEATRVAGPVTSMLDSASFAASANGVLAFRGPDQASQLTWFDRHGGVLARVAAPGPYSEMALSPDGSNAVIVRHASEQTADQDLWLLDTVRGTSRRLTFDPFLETSPVWEPDGRRVIFSSDADWRLYAQPVASGGPRSLLSNAEHAFASSVSPDGRWLLYTFESNGPTGRDIGVLPLDGRPPAAGTPLIRREADQGQAQFSPDGRWVAYVSNESGANRIFLAELAFDGQDISVAPGTPASALAEGTAPRWSRDGKALFYLGNDGTVMVVQVETRGGFHAATPERLFRSPLSPFPMAQWSQALPQWAVAPDGARFLFAAPSGGEPPPFEVIVNWPALLER